MCPSTLGEASHRFVLLEDYAFGDHATLPKGTVVWAWNSRPHDDPRLGPSLLCAWGEPCWIGSIPASLLGTDPAEL